MQEQATVDTELGEYDLHFITPFMMPPAFLYRGGDISRVSFYYYYKTAVFVMEYLKLLKNIAKYVLAFGKMNKSSPGGLLLSVKMR